MALSRISISAPMRGASLQLSRLALRRPVLPAPHTSPSPATATAFARPLSTTHTAAASLTTTATPTERNALVTPFDQQTVLATIHQFPSLEPLRFQSYPANHLHLPTRRDILHRAVVYEGDMTRLGTASTKTRYEVRGSARKIRPQKGSGRARLGDKKSPMLKGGGVSHGPKPRDFSTELQKKVYDLAWRTALSYRFRKGELIIVDNAMEIESPSTRLLSHIFKYHEKQRGKGRSVLVTLEERPMLEQALEELDRGDQALLWDEVDVKNLLEGSRVLIERAALHNILLTHQEDLTHKAVQPWHKSFVRSSAPAELESIIGWPEFRGLMLTDPKEKDAARADAYESVASTRYVHAETLPQGPDRIELTVSAYNLLAEAKRLQFAQKTGLSFNDYLVHQDQETAASLFPRTQALDYQINVKTQLGNAAEETSSRLSAAEHYHEVMQLEVQKAEILHEAALLAAQVHEHIAEAHTLVSEDESAAESLAQASTERTNVDAVEIDLLTARLEVAKQEYQVELLRNNIGGQQAAQKKIKECTGLLEAKQAEAEAWATQSAELSEAEAEAQPLAEASKSS
jgi:large subunit ribosomal protein L4